MSAKIPRLVYWWNDDRLIVVADKTCLSATETQVLLEPILGNSHPHVTESLDDLNPAAPLIYMAESASWLELKGTSLAPPVNRFEVDISKLQRNIEGFAKQVNSPVVAMVKANAYGHGMIQVASFVSALPQVTHLGVATVQEGISLRNAGISKEILVTYPTTSDVPYLFKHELTLAIGDLDLLRSVAGTGLAASVHFDIDTGFHRSGFAYSELPEATKIVERSNLKLSGIMTHLSCADEHGQDELNQSQLDRFAQASELFEDDILRHVGNTATSLLWNNQGWSPARPGIAIYGLHPSELTTDKISIEPIGRLRSEIIQLIDVPGGEFVGYGATWTAPASGARVGLVPSGYGDGISRELSNTLTVTVAGKPAQLVGRVSMDSFVVDVSQFPETKLGDSVIVYSDNPISPNCVDGVASLTGTINYEVTTKLAQRLCRTYSL